MENKLGKMMNALLQKAHNLGVVILNGLTLYDLSNIINGDVQKIIDELMLAENTEKLKADSNQI